MRLKNRVAVITGGGTGLGKAISIAFAKEGAKVIIAGRRIEPLKEVETLITNFNGQASCCQTDVSDSLQVKKMIEECVNRYGKLDTVIANAGVNPSRTNILETSEENWKTTIDINLTGVFFTCKYSMPYLLKNKGGSITVISSTIGLNGAKNRISYGASKGGVNHLVKCMAIDHAKDKIRVNSVCPGRVMTEFVRHLKNSGGDWDEVEKKYPMGMTGKIDDITNAVVYLSSNEASWVTGVNFPVDGGYSA